MLHIIKLFRFGFESSESPPCLFGPDQDVKRVDAIDAEIRASGITRQDEKELLVQLSKTGENSDNEENLSYEDSSDEEDIQEIVDEENESQPIQNAAPLDDIEFLKKEVDKSTAAAMNKNHTPQSESDIKSTEKEVIVAEISALDINSKRIDNERYDQDLRRENEKVSSNDHVNESDYISSVRGPSSRYAPSSVASTIAPEVIKARVKASLEKRKRNQQMKRIRTKGDTSAVTRQRNESKNEIKTSTDAFWAD